MIGDGIPRDGVGTVLDNAPCDVAMLVAREGAVVAPGPEAIVMVPFGGAEHDWAALELASWLCAATGATLELLGPRGVSDDGKDAGHMLANAALLVQQFAGVTVRPVVAEPGADGLVAAAGRANLLLIGLSERWRNEGLGRPDRRSRGPHRPRSCSCAVASGRARSLQRLTSPRSAGRRPGSACRARSAAASAARSRRPPG